MAILRWTFVVFQIFSIIVLSQSFSPRSNQDNITSQETINKLCHTEIEQQFNLILDKILIERVVGTKNHDFVKMYITEKMEKSGWTVELDEFEAVTPNSIQNMTNIVATLNPLADRYIVVACHYDSKKMNFSFVGATDAAVPCAMMLYMSESLNQQFEAFKNTSITN